MERVFIGGQREYWIDVCRGIGIILVLLAHAIKKESILWIAINQFHMPLFMPSLQAADEKNLSARDLGRIARKRGHTGGDRGQ
ncbi:MAG: hypothetical protein ACI4MF_03690 [Candidatus Faecivicinus sp.]